MARRFRERGHRLALCSRSAPVLEEGEGVLARRLDVRDAAAVEGFAREAEQYFGSIDLWINSAGVLEPIAPLREIEAPQALRHVAINLMGTLHGSASFIRHLHRRGGDGVLVNISSGAARRAYAGWSTYCAAKAGVDRLTECIALEERDHGLRAFAVAPGVVDTAMQERIRASSRSDFPELPRFLELERRGHFNSPRFVADHLLTLAFGSTPRDREEVLIRLPNEWEEDEG